MGASILFNRNTGAMIFSNSSGGLLMSSNVSGCSCCTSTPGPCTCNDSNGYVANFSGGVFTFSGITACAAAIALGFSDSDFNISVSVGVVCASICTTRRIFCYPTKASGYRVRLVIQVVGALCPASPLNAFWGIIMDVCDVFGTPSDCTALNALGVFSSIPPFCTNTQTSANTYTSCSAGLGGFGGSCAITLS